MDRQPHQPRDYSPKCKTDTEHYLQAIIDLQKEAYRRGVAFKRAMIEAVEAWIERPDDHPRGD